jgi:voltage-gated sodium channel
MCIVYFLVEVTLKIKAQRWKYFSGGWNRYDFIVTLLSLPSLIVLIFPESQTTWLASASALRAGRLLRFLRLLKFIPNAEHLFKGVSRACKASVGVFIALAILNITLALTATMLFGQISPEHFGDPLKSSYSLLKMFTIEGWYEIPDTIAEQNPDLWLATILRIYAIATVLIGGILGMGLANAIFIDEMTSDNNERLEAKLDNLLQEVASLNLKLNTIVSKESLKP